MHIHDGHRSYSADLVRVSWKQNLWSSSSCGDNCPGWRGVRWPDSAGWGKARPPRAETLAAQRSAPRNIPPTAPCPTNTHTQYTVYTHRPARTSAAVQHARLRKVSTHLSTDSKVFFSGGGRAFTFLAGGPSLSACGGGRGGSVADGGGGGEEGRDSFHPACAESSISIFHTKPHTG